MPDREISEALTEAEEVWLARWALERTYRAVKEARDWDRLGAKKFEDYCLSSGGIEDDHTLRDLLGLVAARCTTGREERRGPPCVRKVAASFANPTWERERGNAWRQGPQNGPSICHHRQACGQCGNASPRLSKRLWAWRGAT